MLLPLATLSTATPSPKFWAGTSLAAVATLVAVLPLMGQAELIRLKRLVYVSGEKLSAEVSTRMRLEEM